MAQADQDRSKAEAVHIEQVRVLLQAREVAYATGDDTGGIVTSFVEDGPAQICALVLISGEDDPGGDRLVLHRLHRAILRFLDEQYGDQTASRRWEWSS